MADDPLQQAAESLEKAAKGLIDLPALLQVAWAQNAQQQAQANLAQQRPLALTQPAYVYQPQTPQQAAAQAQQRQQYPAGGTPAFPTVPAPPPPSPQQAAQQAAGPSPGDLALAAARATQAQAGGVGAGMLERAASAAGRGLSALSVAAGTATAALGTLGTMGAAASPTHAATLSGSVELFFAKAGSTLLPAMEEASRLIQNAARNLPDVRQKEPGLGGYSIQDLLRFSARAGAAVITQGGSEMPGNRAPAALSYAALPQPTVGNDESYYNRLTTAALVSGGVEQETLQEQLKALKDILGVLERGAGGGGEAPIGSFR